MSNRLRVIDVVSVSVRGLAHVHVQVLAATNNDGVIDVRQVVILNNLLRGHAQAASNVDNPVSIVGGFGVHRAATGTAAVSKTVSRGHVAQQLTPQRRKLGGNLNRLNLNGGPEALVVKKTTEVRMNHMHRRVSRAARRSDVAVSLSVTNQVMVVSEQRLAIPASRESRSLPQVQDVSGNLLHRVSSALTHATNHTANLPVLVIVSGDLRVQVLIAVLVVTVHNRVGNAEANLRSLNSVASDLRNRGQAPVKNVTLLSVAGRLNIENGTVNARN